MNILEMYRRAKADFTEQQNEEFERLEEALKEPIAMDYQTALAWLFKNAPEKVASCLYGRLAPAGSPPASGCPTREAGGRPDAKQDATSAPPLPDQGGGSIPELIEHLEVEAARFRRLEKDGLSFQTQGAIRAAYGGKAAKWDRWIAALREIAPLTQSVVEGDERCRPCKGKGYYGYVRDARSKCPHCRGTGSRTERSVSGNAALSGGDRERQSAASNEIEP